MSPVLMELIAEAIVDAAKLAEGTLSKENVLDIIKAAMRAAALAEMQHEFPGQVAK